MAFRKAKSTFHFHLAAVLKFERYSIANFLSLLLSLLPCCSESTYFSYPSCVSLFRDMLNNLIAFTSTKPQACLQMLFTMFIKIRMDLYGLPHKKVLPDTMVQSLKPTIARHRFRPQAVASKKINTVVFGTKILMVGSIMFFRIRYMH